jgi:hypothetical protein
MGNNPVNMIDPDGGFSFGGNKSGPVLPKLSAETQAAIDESMPKYYQVLIVADFSYAIESDMFSDIGTAVMWQNYSYCSVKKLYEPIEEDLFTAKSFGNSDHPYSVLFDFTKQPFLNKHESNKTYTIDGTVGVAGRGWNANTSGEAEVSFFSSSIGFEQTFGGDGHTLPIRFNVETIINKQIYMEGFGATQSGMMIRGKDSSSKIFDFPTAIYPNVSVKTTILHMPTNDYSGRNIIIPGYSNFND